MKAQYYRQVRVPDGEIKHWRRRIDAEIHIFTEYLEENGKHADYAPEPPTTHDYECVMRQPFRILFGWIPDWSTNIDAGHHVIRLDTCEKAEKNRAMSPASGAKPAAQLPKANARRLVELTD